MNFVLRVYPKCLKIRENKILNEMHGLFRARGIVFLTDNLIPRNLTSEIQN